MLPVLWLLLLLPAAQAREGEHGAAVQPAAPARTSTPAAVSPAASARASEPAVGSPAASAGASEPAAVRPASFARVAHPAAAQPRAPAAAPAAGPAPAGVLYAAVLENRRFVVGAKNAPSGLHRFEGDTTWTHLGWKNVRANGFSYVRSRPDTLFLAAGNGAFRSTDGGETWRITSGWEITEVQDVAVDAVAPRHVYLATADGVRHSDNDGSEWSIPSRQVSPTFTQSITADAEREGHIFVGGEGGLFESTDFGRTWQLVGPDGIDVRDVQQCGGRPELWLAGTGGRGVLLSRDGGATWSEVQGDASVGVIYAVAADPADCDRMAAAGFGTGVYVSEDGGESWDRVMSGLSVLDAHAVVFDADGSGRLWVGTVGGGVYRVEPGSRTAEYAGLEGATVWDLVFVQREE